VHLRGVAEINGLLSQINNPFSETGINSVFIHQPPVPALKGAGTAATVN